MSHEEPWASNTLYLMQVPGCGVVTGMTILAAIGRLPLFDQDVYSLVGYQITVAKTVFS
jgi:hypothetical protein